MASAQRLRPLVPAAAPIQWEHDIEVRFHPSLKAANGDEVHAASHMRRRLVILDDALRRRSTELRRIAVHEAFHFVWIRLGNPARRSFEQILLAESTRGARGELGWSAEARKRTLSPFDARNRTLAWREYACESFCDTAAWLYAGLSRHSEFTLAARFCRQRKSWFEHQIERRKFIL